MRKIALMCAAAAVSAFLLANLGICQEEKKAVAAPAQGESKAESIYGEVLDVKEADSSITVQYYDYDTDDEKTVELVFDKDTKLENAAALKDIKVGDWVDADYSSGSLGKKVAKSVKVEKSEEPEPPAAGDEE